MWEANVYQMVHPILNVRILKFFTLNFSFVLISSCMDKFIKKSMAHVKWNGHGIFFVCLDSQTKICSREITKNFKASERLNLPFRDRFQQFWLPVSKIRPGLRFRLQKLRCHQNQSLRNSLEVPSWGHLNRIISFNKFRNISSLINKSQ